MFGYIIIYSQLQEKKMWSEEDLVIADEQYKRDIDKLMEDGLYKKSSIVNRNDIVSVEEFLDNKDD